MGQRYTRWSLRRLSIGVVSVAVSSGVFLFSNMMLDPVAHAATTDMPTTTAIATPASATDQGTSASASATTTPTATTTDSSASTTSQTSTTSTTASASSVTAETGSTSSSSATSAAPVAVKQAVLAAAAPAASDSSATTSEADGGLADMSDAVTSESDIQYNQAHKGKLVNVDKNNFLDYNQTHGLATYDSATGIVTLTPDKNNLAGSVTLKDKIDLNHDFSLTTWTNLGDKNTQNWGGDVIGFAFHTSPLDAVGGAGNNLGIGGLANTVGFKLDTFFLLGIGTSRESTQSWISFGVIFGTWLILPPS
ncbi:MAG: lectin-like domain-containing protein [Limosilactobacillus fermentum]